MPKPSDMALPLQRVGFLSAAGSCDLTRPPPKKTSEKEYLASHRSYSTECMGCKVRIQVPIELPPATGRTRCTRQYSG